MRGMRKLHSLLLLEKRLERLQEEKKRRLRVKREIVPIRRVTVVYEEESWLERVVRVVRRTLCDGLGRERSDSSD